MLVVSTMGITGLASSAASADPGVKNCGRANEVAAAAAVAAGAGAQEIPAVGLVVRGGHGCRVSAVNGLEPWEGMVAENRGGLHSRKRSGCAGSPAHDRLDILCPSNRTWRFPRM
ncbi:MAG: hypothetical protein Ct9H300mP1_39670 [Planctomycetaceae bacterium]|nr:MAG: hypothetical protein Ct9H300mP1_39670 [Planctomycetaceae bacterium]